MLSGIEKTGMTSCRSSRRPLRLLLGLPASPRRRLRPIHRRLIMWCLSLSGPLRRSLSRGRRSRCRGEPAAISPPSAGPQEAQEPAGNKQIAALIAALIAAVPMAGENAMLLSDLPFTVADLRRLANWLRVYAKVLTLGPHKETDSPKAESEPEPAPKPPLTGPETDPAVLLRALQDAPWGLTKHDLYNRHDIYFGAVDRAAEAGLIRQDGNRYFALGA
jgi:hypothetical protein